MSATFNGPVNSYNVLAGITATNGGIFNANLQNSSEDIDSKRFLVSLSLQEVEQAGHFVARENELLTLGNALKSSQARPTAILRGPEGIGKTQLAVKYIMNHKDDYSAVIWLNAKDEKSLKQSFALAAAHIFDMQPSWTDIKKAIDSGNDDDIVRAVKRWLGDPKNNKWLLICDGYNRPKMGNREGVGSRTEEASRNTAQEHPFDDKREATKPYNIRDFYPSTLHGSIIITTRSNLVNAGQLIELGPLSAEDSLKVLEFTSCRKEVDKNVSAKKIAEKLNGLPIALSTVGAFVNRTKISWEECRERWGKESWREFTTKNYQTWS